MSEEAKPAVPSQFLGRINQGDCVEGMQQLPDGCVDLVFADPPFNIGYEYDKYDDRLDDRGRDMLARVARGADRLDQLLADVLLLSRAQRADAVDTPTDTAEVVADVLHELQPVIDATGADVSVAEGLPAMSMDRFWLRQAVYNLVANALKFTHPGEPPVVEIAAYTAEPGEQAVGLVVRDRGPGVEPGMREKVFGLFQRGVGREVPGTGAGLAIVAQVAERYGGRAWVRERTGGGAEVVLTTSDFGR